MDKLHDSLLLPILSRLDNSADVARCRVAWKAFDVVYPGLRSVNLDWEDINSRSRDSNSFRKIFLGLIRKLETVESVSLDSIRSHDDFLLTDEDFCMQWLPRVSVSLKSLSLSSGLYLYCWPLGLKVLQLITGYCHNLVNLELKSTLLCMYNLNPMPTLTSLTLKSLYFDDKELNELSRCFPNLQVLLVDTLGLGDHSNINFLNLKDCNLEIMGSPPSNLTLITPNLITLKVVCYRSSEIHVEAPMLSHFHLSLTVIDQSYAFTSSTKFENLKTLRLDSEDLGSLLSEFPITKSVETLTLYSQTTAPRDAPDSKLTLGKVLMVFPNVSSLCINSYAWSEIEACFNPKDGENVYGRIGLKTFFVYLMLGDPSLTFSCVACVLDQCSSLSEVSLLIHSDVNVIESKSFMSKCMARWPGLKWRWGIWSKDNEDSWITDAISK